jgi:heme-degrading monooxygenase HmoA
MYAVIFQAKVKNPDAEYNQTAMQLRELAMIEYGCINFIATREDGFEIAISYWKNLQQFKKWKQDADHLLAQQNGREKWYSFYKVQVVEIIQEYEHTAKQEP